MTEDKDKDKAAQEKEARRQKQLAEYAKDRAGQCLVVAEAECDTDGKPIKVVRKFAKCHPVSSRHTIEAFKAHCSGANSLVVILPSEGSLKCVVPMGDKDENGVCEKVLQVISLGKAAGQMVLVPNLSDAEDLGSSTIDLFTAIVEKINACNPKAASKAEAK